MDCESKIRVKGLDGKNGRPSYLAQHRESWLPEGKIEPLEVAPMDRADWFSLYGGYIHRAFRTGEPTDGFGVPEPMRRHIEKRLTELTAVKRMKKVPRSMQADRQLSRLLSKPVKRDKSDNAENPGKPDNADKSDDPKLALLSPSSRLSKTGWERACRLASRLMALARREPSLVQSAVLGYCLAATSRHYVIMTDEQDAVYGRLLIEFVKELHISGLKVHLVGFRLGCNLPDIGRWLRVLGLQTIPPVDFETTNNVGSPARLNHVGIKVCWGRSSRTSQEWHEVALLAAITELWRSVTPSHGYELIP